MDQRKLAAARRANRRKLVPLIVAALFYQAALAAVLYFVTGGSPIAAVVGAVIPLALMPLFYFFHRRFVTAGISARAIAIPEDPELFAIAGRLSQLAATPQPAIYSVNEPGINAFSVGLQGQARVYLTEGMLDQLSPELDAGIAQQLVHVSMEHTRIDQLAFALTGWVLLPVSALIGILLGLESAARTMAARISNSGSGIGTFVAWPVYAIPAAVLFLLTGILIAVSVPARLADLLVFRRREIDADAYTASIVSPQAVSNLLYLASRSPGKLTTGPAVLKSAFIDPVPPVPWWRNPYRTRGGVEARRRLLGSMPPPDPTQAVIIRPPAQAAAATAAATAAPAASYSPPPSADLGAVTRREGLVLFEKVFYTVAGIVLGAAVTAAAFLFVINDDDDPSLAAVTATPTVTSTATPRPTRTPTPTPTATSTRTPRIQTEFVVGQTVSLTNGSGNCLQTYSDHTFASQKRRCEVDLTVAKLASGPFRSEEEDGKTYIWWGLEGGGYIIENWIRK